MVCGTKGRSQGFFSVALRAVQASLSNEQAEEKQNTTHNPTPDLYNSIRFSLTSKAHKDLLNDHMSRYATLHRGRQKKQVGSDRTPLFRKSKQFGNCPTPSVSTLACPHHSPPARQAA